MSFWGLSATQDRSDGRIATELVEWQRSDLMPGDITVAVDYSSLNYKDAMAITGGAEVIQSFPLIPGIDLAGTVEASEGSRFSVGDRVVVNGWELGQTHHGGYAQLARLPASWAVPVPRVFSTRDAMAIGTAGYTAMLCIMALEHGGVTPAAGEILVTGASGGVGSYAISLLSKLGFQVVAATGKPDESAYLEDLGATRIIDRSAFSRPGEALADPRWAAAIDSVGSHTLANVLSQIQAGGVVAACGLAQGVNLPGSVLPFILRGVTLSGIDSVYASPAIRQTAWTRLAELLDTATLTHIPRVVGLPDVVESAEALLTGSLTGRIVVDVNAL